MLNNQTGERRRTEAGRPGDIKSTPFGLFGRVLWLQIPASGFIPVFVLH